MKKILETEEYVNRAEELSQAFSKLAESPDEEKYVELCKEYNKFYKSCIFKIDVLAKNLKILLMQNNPWLGGIMSQLCFIRYTTSIKTAATEGLHILVNPLFLAKMDEGIVNFVLLHEMYHVVLSHRARYESMEKIKAMNHRLFNYAADYIVNFNIHTDTMANVYSGIPIEFSDDFLFLRGDDNKLVDLTNVDAETLYERLADESYQPNTRQNPSNDQNNSDSDSSNSMQPMSSFGSGISTNQNQTNSNSTLEYPNETARKAAELADTLKNSGSSLQEDITVEIPNGENSDGDGNMFSNSDTKVNSSELENKINQTFKDLKSMGYSPTGSFDRAVKFALTTTKIRWDLFLKRFLASKVTDETSYDTPNKKYLCHDIILPGPGGMEDSIDNVFCFFDVSGSISDAELLQILNNAYTISHNFNASLSVACWSTSVSSVINDIEPDSFQKVISQLDVQSGGTNISCVYDYVIRNRIKASAIVIFTDGFFSIPNDIPLWIFRKTLIALFDTREYNHELEALGKIVSINGN